MADPVTLSMIGMGANVGGGLLGTVGKIMGGQSQSKTYQYQAGVARVNQQIAEQNAAYSRYVGETEAQRYGMKARYERGQTEVVQSGRGIDVNTGSAAAVRESQGELARHDQDTIRANAARRAYGFEVEGMREKQKENMAVASAKNAKTASYFETGASILGTASSVSSKWLQAKTVGLYGDSNPTAMSSTSWEA